MMNQTLEQVIWTIQDVEGLPENEWIRYEILNGEIFMTRSPHRRHQQTCGKIFTQLDIWSESNNLGVTIFAPGLIFSDIDSVIPDVVWVTHERLEQIEDEAGHLTGAPELVIEVLSPGKQNERRDKQAKLKLYSITGVQEYWVVNYSTKQVEIYRREQAQLIKVATLLEMDEITSPLLPGFSAIVQLFFP
ncbi:MAG TPA: Uma2 family endonuclease [Candidatus Obscuribacterales bacterium]